MRLIPASLAGRVTIVLISGLFLTLVMSLAVAVGERLSGEEGDRYPLLAGRIAALVTAANWTAPERRPELVQALSTATVEARWTPDATPPADAAPDWRSHRLIRDLGRVASGLGGLTSAVESDGQVLWLRLDDGSWLALTFDRTALGSVWLLRLILVLAVLGIGIALLATWAARRVTVPLSRFAAAATRLGTDVGAPPVDEGGPTEIGQAARAFNQMQARLRRLVDDRTRMLAAIAHDLRTVLTRLRLRVELIEGTLDRDKAIEDLETMTTMLDETLAFARDGDAGEPAVEVDLAALVQTLADDLADAGQPVRFTGPPHADYRCRPVALRRALTNLIDNAVAYGGEAEIELRSTQAAAELTIADRGPGILASQRERVFQPFFRLEPSRSRATGGTGLGLAVARTIIHRHGGEIALEDRPGGGLLVRVTLPHGAPASAGPAPPETGEIGPLQAGATAKGMQAW